MRVDAYLNRAAERLAAAPILVEGFSEGEKGARLSAARRILRHLLAARLQVPESHFFAFPERQLGEAQLAKLDDDLARLRAGEPLAYVIGAVPFLDWHFRVDARALAPRPETEALAQMVREVCGSSPPNRLLDLCCGSGVLGLALAASWPACQVDLTDISPEALELAQENAQALGLGRRTNFYLGDLFQPLRTLKTTPRYEWILANPPYVAELDPVQAGVLRHEPALALWSEDNGQAHIKRILLELDDFLEPNGRAAFELGHLHHQSLVGWLNQHLSRPWRFEADPFAVPRYLLVGF